MIDSKQMNAHSRAIADSEIRTIARAVGLGWVTSREIDAVGLTQAVRLAMQRAVAEVTKQISEYSNINGEIIIDGSYNYLADNPRTSVLVKADATVPAVSAASIVAKVARDSWMISHASLQYPEYGFESHVGYGTKQHSEALLRYGPCDIHRFSYKPVQLAAEAHHGI